MTIIDPEAVPQPGCLDAPTRAVLVKLIGVAIDRLGVDAARSLAPALVGYLAGAPYEGGMPAGQRARAVAARPRALR